MDARLTRDGLLRLELRLDMRQREALYRRFAELRRHHGALSDHECLRMLITLEIDEEPVEDDAAVAGG